MDFDQLMASAKLPTRTVRLCMRGDLAARYAQLQGVLDAAKEAAENGTGRFDDGAEEVAARAEMQELAAEMEQYTLTLTMQAVSRGEYRRIMAACPPKEGDETDAVLGWDREKFPRDLVRRCIADPKLSDEQFARLMDAVTDRQYENLTDAAIAVNRRDVDVPFSRNGSTKR